MPLLLSSIHDDAADHAARRAALRRGRCWRHRRSGTSAAASAAALMCFSGPCSSACVFAASARSFDSETCHILLKWIVTRVDVPGSGLYAQAVRFLLVNNHCISDPTAGVTQSLRTIMEWLADAGHACHILTTARFESRVTFTIEEHLRQQGVDVSPRSARRDRTVDKARSPTARRALRRRETCPSRCC